MYLGGRFFDTQAGGSAVLWQHFFWIFGHPEVYVLMIPGFACVSEIIPVFSRKPIFGYPVMVGATSMIGLISMGVWAHHMFTVGMTSIGNTFFAISTMLVCCADRHQDLQLARNACMAARFGLNCRCFSALAFLFQFLIAGLTGIMLGCCAFQLAAD